MTDSINTAKVSFIEKESYIAKHGLAGTAKYTPVYMLKEGQPLFIRNAINDNFNEVAEIKKQLEKTNGMYFTSYCGFGPCDPIDFINWVKSNNYTFEDCTAVGKYNTDEDGFVDFGGNLKQVSCAFDFRIYDKEMVKEIVRLTGFEAKLL